MASVCEIKSEDVKQTDQEKQAEDLEDGEITDDDDETELLSTAATAAETPNEEITPITAGAQPTVATITAAKKCKESKESKDKSFDQDRLSGNEDNNGKERERGDRRDKDSRRSGSNRGTNREDKSHRHMTEAEKSILHLRKREKLLREREKWEKQHRKDDPLDDDFAKNIEKTLATILHKKEKDTAGSSANEDIKVEEKKGKKRKKNSKDKAKKKMRTNDSPRSEIDENEMLNIRSGSPGNDMRLHALINAHSYLDSKPSSTRSRSRSDDTGSDSIEEREERCRRRISKKSRRKKDPPPRDRNRRDKDKRHQTAQEQATKLVLQDSQGVCVFYMQGKCQKNDCPYSHEVTPPMKLELCKFYLMDCCAKGEKCSYMHSEFPCKFYHTGLQCTQGDNCRFAHGNALSDGLKQILFKHIETAPRDILGGFPRLSREEALNLINATQQKLTEQTTAVAATAAAAGGTDVELKTISSGSQNNNSNKSKLNNDDATVAAVAVHYDENEIDEQGKETKPRNNRTKQSRWQSDMDSVMTPGFPIKSFYGTDQDMRISSNGDVDMRTLPNISNIPATVTNVNINSEIIQKSSAIDIDTRVTNVLGFSKDIDIRQTTLATIGQSSSSLSTMDVDIRQLSTGNNFDLQSNKSTEILRITNDDKQQNDEEEFQSQRQSPCINSELQLPQATKELFARISANQKDNTVATVTSASSSSSPKHLIDSSQPFVQQDIRNINWFSDDDDDDDDDDENRLTISGVEDDEKKEKNDDILAMNSSGGDMEETIENNDEKENLSLTCDVKTEDIVGKLGDLSKIDISAEVSKLLASMSQSRNSSLPTQDESISIASNRIDNFNYSIQPAAPPSSTPQQDPRLNRQDPRLTQSNIKDINRLGKSAVDQRQDPRLNSIDPRQRSRQSSTEEKKDEKKRLSIYEQGGIDMKRAALEIDTDEYKTQLRPDIDLRNMSLPFKGMQNYTPATEIDASINSHPPMPWKVIIVDIPRPDYTGLKLSINEAEKTGDPRLRKIFRLSTEEKDSPMSPKASPKHVPTNIRSDPRLKKMEEKSSQDNTIQIQQQPTMTYGQQLSMLQSSQFYQSLTSNQKLMLNKELAPRDDQAINDPVLSSLLSSLNLIPQTAGGHTNQLAANPTLNAALSFLASVAVPKINPMMTNQAIMPQQGLLGAAPGIPNMPATQLQQSALNFNPRNGGGGVTGAAYTQFGAAAANIDQQFGANFTEDFYGNYDESNQQQLVGGIQLGTSNGGGGGNVIQGNNNYRQGRGYNNGGNNNNNRDSRRRGNRNFGRGRNFKRGGRDNRDGRDRDNNRSSRGHHSSP